MTTLTKSYVFVYGTLLRAAQHPMHALFEQHAIFHAKARLQARLYRIADYPGAQLSSSSSDAVYGEVYEFSPTSCLLALLDDYEECSSAFSQPHEYVRQQVEVTTDNGKQLLAWAYLYHHPVASLQQIESGSFVADTEIKVR